MPARRAASRSQTASPTTVQSATATPMRSWQARNRSGSGLARKTSPRSTTTTSARTPGPPATRRSPVDGPTSRCRTAATRAQVRQQLDRAGQRPSLGQQLAVELAVAPPGSARPRRPQVAADLARDRPREQPAAHADAPMDPPALQRQPGLDQRALPGEDVRIDGVDQRAVEVEDQCSSHVVNLRPSEIADD